MRKERLENLTRTGHAESKFNSGNEVITYLTVEHKLGERAKIQTTQRVTKIRKLWSAMIGTLKSAYDFVNI